MERKVNAFFKKGRKPGLGARFALGLGLVILGPAIASLVGRLLRPVARAAMHGGMAIYQEVGKIAMEAKQAEQEAAHEKQAMIPTKQAGSSDQKEASGTQAESPKGADVSQADASRSQARERPAPWIVRGY